MRDWVIVGGGVHGTHLSLRLLGEAGVRREALRVVDPEALPLAAFARVVDAVGMTYLRSPAVHHIDLDPRALERFAASPCGRRLARFHWPYRRPGLDLFWAHARAVVEHERLAEVHDQATVQAVRRGGRGWRILTDRGDLEARNVILAVGAGGQLAWPPWASHGSERIDHVFAPSFARRTIGAGERVIIVGGGISAAQLALVLVEQGARPTLVVRHPLRVHTFDSAPGWIGPRFLVGFARSRHEDRRGLIDAARNRGSVPSELYRRLRWAIDRGAIVHVEGEIARADRGAPLRVELTDGRGLDADRLVLATGYARGGAANLPWIRTLAADEGLATAPCGTPLVTRSLAWAEGLFVSGGLAELEIGPAARNIIGARIAGDRLVTYLQEERSRWISNAAPIPRRAAEGHASGSTAMT